MAEWWEEFVDVLTDYIPGGDAIDDYLGIVGRPGPSGTRQQNTATPPMQSPATSNGNGRSYANAMPGCQVTVPMGSRMVASCPPGYVAVDTDGDGVSDTCMMKEVATACKLYKRRPKPLLTAADRRTLNRASRVMGRVDNVVKQTNKIRGQARLTKARPSRR